MNVFFDLECANCHMGIAKICEFGYVLADDNLNIIEADNYLIDPRSSFNLYGFKMAGISLTYPPKLYRSSPPLKDYYDRIKALLCDKSNRVFGYSVEYDAEYINTDFNRSGLDAINFKFIDVMKLFRDYLGRSEKLSLDVMYSECEGVEPLVHHEAKNDSLMTLECMRLFLKKSGMTFKQAVNECPKAYGELFNGRVVRDGTAFHYTLGNRMSATNTQFLKDFLASSKVTEPIKGVEGKTFCFEKEYGKSHFAEVLYSADLITSAGGRLTNIIAKADYIIVADKLKRIAKAKRQRVISLADFASMLSVSLRSFDQKRIDVDALLAKIPENTEWYKQYLKHLNKK